MTKPTKKAVRRVKAWAVVEQGYEDSICSKIHSTKGLAQLYAGELSLVLGGRFKVIPCEIHYSLPRLTKKR